MLNYYHNFDAKSCLVVAYEIFNKYEIVEWKNQKKTVLDIDKNKVNWRIPFYDKTQDIYIL